jgi:hypothetical protein
VSGVERWLAKLWSAPQRTYYLGEWHFHPYASPEASATDAAQMRTIATSAGYRCPEPLLLVLGGDPNGDWKLRAYVFPAGSTMVTMRDAVPEKEFESS